jgi:hypothetical protein
VIWCSHPITVVGIAAKYWDKEDAFQIYCATWLRKYRPSVRFHHSANERQGGKAGFFARLKGQSKGFPDLLIFDGSIALELKVGNYAASSEQVDWLAYFKSIGWHSEIIRSFDRFKELLS